MRIGGRGIPLLSGKFGPPSGVKKAKAESRVLLPFCALSLKMNQKSKCPFGWSKWPKDQIYFRVKKM